MAATTAGAVKEKTLFGHPRGLTYLFSTEMAERWPPGLEVVGPEENLRIGTRGRI